LDADDDSLAFATGRLVTMPLKGARRSSSAARSGPGEVGAGLGDVFISRILLRFGLGNACLSCSNGDGGFQEAF